MTPPRPARILAALTVSVALAASAAGARPDQVGTPNGVQAKTIGPDLYLVSGSDGNLLVLVGADGPVVVGEPARSLTGRAQALLASLHAPPVHYVLVTAGANTGQRGDREWITHGAICIAHEGIRFGALSLASSDPGRRSEVPEIGFSEVLQLGVDGEEIHAVHQEGGYSAADVSVHFERRHVLYLGGLFTTDGYPAIAVDQGGSIDGLIAAASKFIGMFGSAPSHVEPIVPGRGPAATMQDLKDYGQMLESVRARVAGAAASGESVESVVRAHPTAQFDARWGKGPVTPDQFVAMVYRSLLKAQKK